MLFELVLFLIELIVGLVYPLLLTIKLTVVTAEDYREKFQS
jgi:hypothetical protein